MSVLIGISALDRQDRKQMVDDYVRGMSIQETAAKWRASYHGVWNYLKRNGVPIRPDHFKSNRRYLFDTRTFDKVDTEAKAYWLGFLYADGCNSENRHTITLSLAEEDAEHVFRFAAFLKLERHPRWTAKRTVGSQRMCSIQATDIHFSDALAALGVMKAKTFKLCFPTPNQVPDHLIRHFVRGYFDGDGCIARSIRQDRKLKRPVYHVSVVSTEAFCLSLAALIEQELDIRMVNRVRFKNRKTNTRMAEFGGNEQVMRFLNWLYADSTIWLERKRERHQDLQHLMTFRPTSVCQLDDDGNEMAVYASPQEAAKAIGGNWRNIQGICNGSAKTYRAGAFAKARTHHAGYRWKYIHHDLSKHLNET